LSNVEISPPPFPWIFFANASALARQVFFTTSFSLGVMKTL
jgi:hypothetical protein